MAIDRRWLALAVPVLLVGATPPLGPEVERDTVVPEGASFQPQPEDETAAMDRFAAYTLALSKRDFAAAYAMLRLSFQASNPRLEWEINQRKREALWADGTIRVLRPPSRPSCSSCTNTA